MSFILLGILNSQTTATASGAFDLLETTVLGSNAASVTFSNLGNYSAYKHLQVRFTARSARTAFNVDDINMRLNSDTGNNYSSHYLFGDGSSVSSGANPTSSNPQTMYVGSIATNLADANVFGAGVIDVLDFSNTSKNTTIRSLAGAFIASTRRQIGLRSGVWLNTGAVTSITIYANSDNLVTGSRFSLYGVK